VLGTMKSGDVTLRWLPQLFATTSPRLRLFCFPYAGGSASIYTAWSACLRTIDVRPVQLPGRGSRFREPALTSVSSVLDAMWPAFVPLLDRPFALFGHSMGALLAFETARRLRHDGRRSPEHLFVAARRAPHVLDRDYPPLGSPDDVFVSALRELNGTPMEVLKSDELMRLVLPAIRADFELLMTYTYAAGPPLDCPMTVFGGTDDPESCAARLEGWHRYTTGSTTQVMCQGDHFFLHSAHHAVLSTIADSLGVSNA